MKQELQNQRTEQIMSMNNENLSPNKAIREEQIRLRLQKDIDLREEEIISFRCQIDQLESKLAKKENRVTAMDREMRETRDKSRELEDFLDELRNEILAKDQKIISLEETARELQSFINETRSSVARDSSSDCLDISFSTSNNAGNVSDGGENLAKHVIEVQLKEKETENQQLQDLLLTSSEEKKRLRTALKSRDETIESMQKSVANMQIEIKEQMTAVSSQLKTAQEARNEFQELLESEKQKFEELRLQEDESRIQIVNSLRLEIEQKTNELQEINLDMSQLRKTHEKEVQKLNKNKKSLIEKMTKSKDASFIKMESDFLMKLKKAEDERHEVVKRLEELVSVHEKDMQSLEKFSDNIQESNSNLTSTLAERNQTIDEITLEKVNLLKKLSSAQDKIQVTQKEMEIKTADTNVEISNLKKTQDEEVGKILSQKFVIENKLLEKTRELDHLAKQSAQEQNDLKEQIRTCEVKITELQDEKEKLQHNVDSLQKKIDEKCSQHELVMEKLCEEVSKTSSTAKENQELKMKMQQREISTADDLKILQKELDDKIEILSALTEQKEDAEKLLEEVRIEMKSANEEISKKADENSQLKLQIFEMKKSSEESLENISRLQAEVQNEKQQCLQSLEKMEHDSSSYTDEIEALKNKMQQQKITMTDESKKELHTINETQKMVLLQKKEMETLLDQLKIELDMVKTKFEKQVHENSRLKQDIGDQELQIENIELQKSLLFEEKESVVRLKAIAENNLQTLKESLITKAAEVERLKAEISDKSLKISSVEKCNENLRVELKDFNERINSERNQVKLLEQKVQENEDLVNVLHMTVDELKDTNTKFELGLKVIENENENLLTSLNEKYSKALNDLSATKFLVSELQSKEKVLKEAVQKNAKIKVEFEVLQTQHEIIQERSRGLELIISSTKEENLLLKAEIESNSKKIHDLGNDNNQKSLDSTEKLREQQEKIQQLTVKIEDANAKFETENNTAQLTINSQNKEMQEMRDSVFEKESTILEMVSQIDELKTVYREQLNGLEKKLEASSSNDSARVQELLKKLEAQKDIEKKLQALEEAHTKEQIFNNKMQEENQVNEFNFLKEH